MKLLIQLHRFFMRRQNGDRWYCQLLWKYKSKGPYFLRGPFSVHYSSITRFFSNRDKSLSAPMTIKISSSCNDSSADGDTIISLPCLIATTVQPYFARISKSANVFPAIFLPAFTSAMLWSSESSK